MPQIKNEHSGAGKRKSRKKKSSPAGRKKALSGSHGTANGEEDPEFKSGNFYDDSGINVTILQL